MSRPLGVVVLQVGLHLLDQLGLVRAVRVEPEHAPACPSGARASTASLTQSRIGASLTWHMRQMSPCLDVLRQQHLAGGDVDDARDAVFGDLEGLVVRAVFLGLLRHQADVGHRAHRRRVELAVGLAEVDDLLVDAGEGALRDHRLGVLRAAVGAPHLAADADHRRHRRVDDHVVRRVQVGDALGRVDHRQLGPVLVAGVQVAR